MPEYFEDLTKFELISLLHSSQTLGIAFFSLFITILFAYLAMAYFAATRLTRFQMVTISTIYSFAIFFTIIGISGSTRDVDTISQVLAGTSYTTPLVNFAFIGLLFVAWIVSILFFYQARRAK